jgi:2-polyprenyl-3-methyl-5-hydroxy-6-metoxy-1,4-benzoquinol methylase
MTKAYYERAVRRADEWGRRMVAHEPCPVCGAREVRVTYDIEGLASRLVTCETCGTGRLFPLPSEAEIEAFYPEAYYGDPSSAKFLFPVEWLIRLIGGRHVRFFLRELAPAARVLDVGCGRGVLLREIAERGFEAHGVEANAPAARGADPRAEVRIAPRLADAGYPAAFFDEVVIWHVLEHLRDPRGTLEEVRRILRPGGRLVVAVPNFSSAQARWAGPAWFHLDLPRHLFHFPLPALVQLLEGCGFVVESEHHFSLRQNPFGWVQSALNMRSLPRNGLYTLLHDRAAHAGGGAAFDPMTRLKLLAGGALALPPALVLTLIESWFRTGATVHVVARVAPAPPAGA